MIIARYYVDTSKPGPTVVRRHPRPEVNSNVQNIRPSPGETVKVRGLRPRNSPRLGHHGDRRFRKDSRAMQRRSMSGNQPAMGIARAGSSHDGRRAWNARGAGHRFWQVNPWPSLSRGRPCTDLPVAPARKPIGPDLLIFPMIGGENTSSRAPARRSATSVPAARTMGRFHGQDWSTPVRPVSVQWNSAGTSFPKARKPAV